MKIRLKLSFGQKSKELEPAKHSPTTAETQDSAHLIVLGTRNGNKICGQMITTLSESKPDKSKIKALNF